MNGRREERERQKASTHLFGGLVGKPLTVQPGSYISFSSAVYSAASIALPLFPPPAPLSPVTPHQQHFLFLFPFTFLPNETGDSKCHEYFHVKTKFAP